MSLGFLLCPAMSSAFPNYAALFKAKYGYLPSCLACHMEDNWDNNDYGKDFRKAGRDLAALQAIEKKDSDGDGFSNLAEILAKSNPGDKLSTPKHPGGWLDNAGIHPPQKLLKSAFPGAVDLEVQEFPLDAKTGQSLSKAWGAPLPDESRFSIIFLASKGRFLMGLGTYLSVDLPGTDDPTLIFIGSSSPGRLAFLKIIKYEGSSALSKDKAWTSLLDKDADGIRADSAIKGKKEEIETFKKAVIRGLLVLDSFRTKS